MPLRSHVALLLAGEILTAGGAGFAYASVAWTMEGRYSLSVIAPDGVRWAIWAPQPDKSSVIETSGDVSLGTPVDTLHGTLDNITGVGTATMSRTYRVSVFMMNADPWSLVRPPELTGRDGDGYWLSRSSTDPNVVISIYGYTVGRASRLGDAFEGAGNGFWGDLAEGWTILTHLCCGDGVGMFSSPSAADLSLATFVAGGIFLAIGVRSKVRKPTAA